MKKACKIFSFVAAFILILPSLSPASQSRVIRIVDGHTIIVDYKGKNEKVALLCVKTPDPVPAYNKRNIPLGKVASGYTESRLKGKYVNLEFEGPFSGRYGVLLAYVYVDGVNLNIELVKQGLSPYYTEYGLSLKYDKEFKEAEAYARKHKLNIWGNPELTKRYLALKSEWDRHRPEKTSIPVVIKRTRRKCVADKNSNVFHRTGCKYIKDIDPKNLIEFNSRQEAIKSGRKPCKVCKP
jgi:micrococcal nuclease